MFMSLMDLSIPFIELCVLSDDDTYLCTDQLLGTIKQSYICPKFLDGPTSTEPMQSPMHLSRACRNRMSWLQELIRLCSGAKAFVFIQNNHHSTPGPNDVVRVPYK